MITAVLVTGTSASLALLEAPLVLLAVALRCSIGVLDDIVCDRASGIK